MKIDFHVHGTITCKYLYHFDEEEFVKKINEAKKEKMDAFALTEHCHSECFPEAYNFLNKNYEYKNDYYEVDGIKVFVGIEITTIEELDILVIGKKEYIEELRYEVEKAKEDQKYIGIERLFKICDTENNLIILAHPYRRHDEFPEISEFVLRKIDAIEYNAKDLYKKGIEKNKHIVSKLAQNISKPITGGSDSHHHLQIGSIMNNLKKDINKVIEIKKEIRKDNYIVEISENLINMVEEARLNKKTICGKE